MVVLELRLTVREKSHVSRRVEGEETFQIDFTWVGVSFCRLNAVCSHSVGEVFGAVWSFHSKLQNLVQNVAWRSYSD
jgi:hypothetical protein